MQIGKTFERRGQRYRSSGTVTRVTKDGRWLEMLALETSCPDCGASFEMKATATGVKRGDLTRRCPSCRAPGHSLTPRAVENVRKASQARSKSEARHATGN